eukprot:CAMPEP_0173383398 /NCGR_PEP_ID=MMETSP1356-20130122/5970_1 /TAXON_ID=77927 ORGANISM="Hemiselmis virescens, Strain PCC157" /NCGR_SAMPLE_ID=MMETSP1356 /ASSEMBLY_ACC=CAM_ASM_000847 /LENGTH=285 /DNA_ID=CAMNT_0014338245 /DNA_START=20 /DNA_END=874 /DNA_ORIENTATION=-
MRVASIARSVHATSAFRALLRPARQTHSRGLFWRNGASVWWGQRQQQLQQRAGTRALHCSSEAEATKDVWSRLKSRSLVLVEGTDAVKFLQGMTTNDFVKLAEPPHGRSMAGAFLNNQGRILYDFIATLAAPDKIYLDVCASQSQDLQKLLKKFKLRAKVTIQDVSDQLDLVAALGPDVGQWFVSTTASAGDVAKDGTLIMQDPRLIDLGVRAIVPKGSGIPEEWQKGGWGEVPEEAFDVYRVCRGVGQGPIELSSGAGMPLECNLELFSGVAFNKGCYVGQELT